MNKVIKNLYVAIQDNEVFFVETNLKEFVSGLKEMQLNVKSYEYYCKKFKKERIQTVVNGKNLIILQKVL